jgi:hypothetical protein
MVDQVRSTLMPAARKVPRSGANMSCVKAEVNRLYGIVHYSVGFDLDQPVRVDEA